MTKEQREKLVVLSKYPEFAVLEELFKEYVTDLTDIRRSVPNMPGDANAEKIGRIWAWGVIDKFLEELMIVRRDTSTPSNGNFN